MAFHIRIEVGGKSLYFINEVLSRPPFYFILSHKYQTKIARSGEWLMRHLLFDKLKEFVHRIQELQTNYILNYTKTVNFTSLLVIDQQLIVTETICKAF